MRKMTNLHFNSSQSINDIVRVYTPYIRAIINKVTLNFNFVIDNDDLFQSGSLALIVALRYNKNESYLKASVRNAIFYQANRYYGCFTINRNVASKVSSCHRDPSQFLECDPIFKLTFHKVEGYYA